MFESNAVFEFLIENLITRGYAVMDDFISTEHMVQLHANLKIRLESGEMKQGGVGQHTTFQKNNEIRKDLISWIEETGDDPAEKMFMTHLWDFAYYLNQTCYTGLDGLECHYAWYDKGSYYKRHRDQFKTDSGRKYSMVTYLNPDWSTEDGGALVLYHNHQEIKIEPIGGRVVFFQSDQIDHEVLPANRPRLSIAGWFKRH